MPDLTIPEQHATGFAKIIGLSSDESKQVEIALSKAKSINLKGLTDLVFSAVPSLTIDGAREIVGTLLSLYAARTGQDMTVDAFVAALIEATAEGRKPRDGSDSQSEVARNTLRNLLSVRPLSMIAKARNLHTDHENTFCAARILTDLRPVFDVDVQDAPAGFAMAHILKLGYHHSGEHAELHVAMDKVDIETLMLALQRAKVKAATLTAVSNQSGFSILAD